MTEHERESLRAAVETLHGCKASFQGEEVCRAGGKGFEHVREVATFALTGHPTAPLAYAWIDAGDGRIHLRVVLSRAGVVSPTSALTGFLLFGDRGGPGNTSQSDNQ
jgi:hypothetical protein